MERWVDIYTRLGVERILFLGSEVNDGIANSLVAQMLYLDSEDSSKPIICTSIHRGAPSPPVWRSTTPSST